MRLAPLFIVAITGIAMLSVQMSGLHMHASVDDEASRLHGTHVHDIGSDSHDHSADVDVSVLDLGIVWSKLMPMLLAIAVVLAVVWTRQTEWPLPIRILSLRRQFRWRPPLRAPPLSP